MSEQPKKPEPPLSRFVLKGIGFGYPDWMFEEHFQTPCGIAIAPDLNKTYPVKLNAKQRTAVDRVKERARLYR